MIFNLNAAHALAGMLMALVGADATTAPVPAAGEVLLSVPRPGGSAELVGRTSARSGSLVQIVALGGSETPDLTPWEALRGGRPVARVAVGPAGGFRYVVPPVAYGHCNSLGALWVGAGGAVRMATTRLPAHDPAVPLPAPPAPGSVIVTEFMKDPAAVSDARGEWVELHNRSGGPLDLEGWTLRDLGSNSTVLVGASGALPIAPGGFVVLGRNADPSLNGGVTMDAVYSGFVLANGADEIILEAPGGLEIDRVEYGDGPVWPDESGRSVSLSPRAWGTPLAQRPESWCSGDSPMPAGDLGTPGLTNPLCGG